MPLLSISFLLESLLSSLGLLALSDLGGGSLDDAHCLMSRTANLPRGGNSENLCCYIMRHIHWGGLLVYYLDYRDQRNLHELPHLGEPWQQYGVNAKSGVMDDPEPMQ